MIAGLPKVADCISPPGTHQANWAPVRSAAHSPARAAKSVFDHFTSEGYRRFRVALEQDYIDDPNRPMLSLFFKGRTGGLVTSVRPESARTPARIAPDIEAALALAPHSQMRRTRYASKAVSMLTSGRPSA